MGSLADRRSSSRDRGQQTLGPSIGDVLGCVYVDADEDALAEAVSPGPVSVAIVASRFRVQLYSGCVRSFKCGSFCIGGRNVLLVCMSVDMYDAFSGTPTLQISLVPTGSREEGYNETELNSKK